MSVQFSNGRFWLCPQCRRHVPVRKHGCVCGFDRTTAQVEVREVAMHAPQSEPQGRSSLATLLLLAVIAALGWIAHDRLPGQPADAPESASPPVAVSPVAIPQPVSVEVVKAPDDGTHAFGAQRSSLPPAAPQAPIQRIEAPQQEIAPASRVSAEDEDERRASEERAARRRQETEWRTRAASSIERLRTAHAGYRSQVCSEARGGIAVSTTRDNAGAYVSARSAAQALEESARLAGVPPGWVHIPWGEFQEPEDPASGYHPAAVAERWGCGNVTGWGH